MNVRSAHEPEWQTRKERIDPRLDAKGWVRVEAGTARRGPCRVEELETDHGPADYALALNGEVVGIIEAKKLTIGPQNVLTQAVRYGKGCCPASSISRLQGAVPLQHQRRTHLVPRHPQSV